MNARGARSPLALAPDYERSDGPTGNNGQESPCHGRGRELEKALLDWIYLNRQEGLPTPLDELQLQFLTPAKLRDYALRFPRTVSETVKDFLVEAAFPSQNPDERRPRAGR